MTYALQGTVAMLDWLVDMVSASGANFAIIVDASQNLSDEERRFLRELRRRTTNAPERKPTATGEDSTVSSRVAYCAF